MSQRPTCKATLSVPCTDDQDPLVVDRHGRATGLNIYCVDASVGDHNPRCANQKTQCSCGARFMPGDFFFGKRDTGKRSMRRSYDGIISGQGLTLIITGAFI